MKMIFRIWPYLVILMAILLLNRGFLKTGIPNTHDGHSHLARIANYYLALRDGHFPVKWAPNLNYKFGYPVFQFHYQTPYFFAALFYKIGLSLEQSYKMVYLVFSLVAGLSTFWWLRQHLNKIPALMGSLIFISSPPFILQIFVRGAFGEFTAWCLMPLLFYVVNKFIKTEKQKSQTIWFVTAVIIIATIILSHIMLASFALGFVFIYGLILIKNINLYKLMRLLLMFLLGVTLSGFFLLPALLESKYITFSSPDLTKSFAQHFVSIIQFFYSPWGYGYSVAGSQDTMSFMLGIAGMIPIIILCLNLILKLPQLNKLKKILLKENIFIYFSVCTFLSIIMMNNISLAIWKLFPYLWQLQFPWRLLVIPSISLAVLGSFALAKFNNKLLYLVTFIAILVQIYLFAKPSQILHLSDYEYFEFPFTSSVNNELLPNGFDMYKNLAYTFQVKDLNNFAKIDITDWKTASHNYWVESTSSANIVERLAYMPGWELWVDGYKQNFSTQNPDYPGLPNFVLDAGKHRIETKLTENMWDRKLGNFLSLATLIGLGLLSLFNLKKYVAN